MVIIFLTRLDNFMDFVQPLHHDHHCSLNTDDKICTAKQEAKPITASIQIVKTVIF